MISKIIATSLKQFTFPEGNNSVMEGLAGIAYKNTNILSTDDHIVPMIETLKHRNPKGRDLLEFKNIKVGICGGKFFHNQKQSIAIAIDGSIYNYSEVLKELKSNGLQLQSSKTEELILLCYEHWGDQCFQRLSGDFAILIVDKKKERIFIARDRIGKKPLYWYHSETYFIFASELKGILATGLVPKTPALDALGAYLYLGYTPQDMSPIEGVNKLLPGHYLQYNFDGSKFINPYWSYSSFFQKTHSVAPEKIIEDIDLLLKKSIAGALPNEKIIGTYLSGGLGSATIAHYLEQFITPQNLRSFTVGFYGENDEDVAIANKISTQLGIAHEVFSVTQNNFLDDLVKIIWHLDEPLADPNIIATWEIASMASKQVETLFSGMGSDELFAGHSRYTTAEQNSSFFRKGFNIILDKIKIVLISIFKKIYKPFAYKLLKSRVDPMQMDYIDKNAFFSEKEIAKAFPKFAKIFDPDIFVHKFHHLDKIKSTVGGYLYFDVKTRLPDCYALQFERLTAAHGLNWRAPLFEHHIVEYLAQIPEPEVLEEAQVASYLKGMVKDVFPPEIINRPKRTRKKFLKNWIETSEIEYIFNLLLCGTLVETGLISKVWLEDQIKNLKSDSNAFRYLWSILILEIWFRLYINNPMQSSPPQMSVEELLTKER